MDQPTATDQPKTCPECGLDLSNRDIIGHAADHWPHDMQAGPHNVTARQRRNQLGEMSGVPRDYWPWRDK